MGLAERAAQKGSHTPQQQPDPARGAVPSLFAEPELELRRHCAGSVAAVVAIELLVLQDVALSRRVADRLEVVLQEEASYRARLGGRSAPLRVQYPFDLLASPWDQPPALLRLRPCRRSQGRQLCAGPCARWAVASRDQVMPGVRPAISLQAPEVLDHARSDRSSHPSAGARRGPGVTGIQLSRRRSRRCMFEDEDRDVVMVILAVAVAPRAPSGQACVHRPPPQPGRHLREAGSRLRTAEGPRASSRARCTSVVADHAAVPFHGETVSGSTSSPACGCRAAPRLAASASVATEWTPGGAHGTSRRRAWVFRDARNRQVLRRSGTRPQGARRMPHRVR